MFPGELLVEGLEDVQHLLQQVGLWQDGGAEVVGPRPLAEPAARDHADTCPPHGSRYTAVNTFTGTLGFIFKCCRRTFTK